MDDMLAQFLIEGRDLVAQAEDDLAILADLPSDRARLDSLFRAVHTLKGSVALFDMAPAERTLHIAEDLLDAARQAGCVPQGTALGGLTETLDQTARWIDAMEANGAIDSDADRIADALCARLTVRDGLSRGEVPSGSPEGGPVISLPHPDWLGVLLERRRDAVAAAQSDLVAFRYLPDPDCFFRGDDPLAVVMGVPGLAALDILPTGPWPILADFEPYHCAVVIEGLSSAEVAEVRAAFRFVPDETDFLEVPVHQIEASHRVPDRTLQSLRVEVSRIDALASGVGELIVAANAFSHIAADADKADPRIGAAIRAAQTDLERAVTEMRGAVMAVRSVSLGPSLRRLPRMVRELSQSLGKDILFSMTGESVEVDKAIADTMFEPLLHLVRNAVDHGIESTAVRLAAGKPAKGMVRLEIRPDGDHVAITLSDDGAGMTPAQLRDHAVAKGLLDRDAADALDDAQALRLIFLAGFSTALTVSSVSGRGVGMDAVRLAVEQQGGKIDISSVPSQGTSIRVRLPQNAILTRLLIVRIGSDRYGVPLDRITETASIPADAIKSIGAGQACVLRDRTLPVLSLATLLGSQNAPAPVAKLLVTETGGEAVGLTVDGFGERIDGLVRPGTGILSGVPGVAGTTLLGDGGVLIVLDLAGLAA